MRIHTLLVVLVCATSQQAFGAVFINEIMANPGAGDWNQDGVADFSADEFVEIVNRGVREVDISSWTLSDAVGVRHVFAYPTILRPGGSVVVFGGGNPSGLPGLAVAASTGSLGLNNTGDTVELRDGAMVVDQVSFGTPLAGTSINRHPDQTEGAPFGLHDGVAGAIGTGSPGLGAAQAAFEAPPLTLPFINEWLPRPVSIVNDWNGDGIATDFDDEFVEILNPVNGGTVDLGGWTLRDAATPYHTFAWGTVLVPGASIVVLAGGPPTGIPGLAIEAVGWGNISNSADDLYLSDETGELVSHVRHTSQTPDISWNRDPDGAPNTPFFALHAELAPGRFSSPGRAADGTPFAMPASPDRRILFLDRCASSCQYSAGVDDARANVSSLVSGTRILSAFPYGDTSWNAVVDCVLATFAPFAITVTDVEPGAVEHLEVAIGGTPQQLGLPGGVASVAPVTCNGDRVVDDGIGFVFAQAYGDVPLELCWNAAQAAGSLLGLDRALLAGDVMTYLPGSLPKAFLDEDAQCGEFSARTCQCGGTAQNSYRHLLSVLPEPGEAVSGSAALLMLVGLASRRRTRAGRLVAPHARVALELARRDPVLRRRSPRTRCAERPGCDGRRCPRSPSTGSDSSGTARASGSRRRSASGSHSGGTNPAAQRTSRSALQQASSSGNCSSNSRTVFGNAMAGPPEVQPRRSLCQKWSPG